MHTFLHALICKCDVMLFQVESQDYCVLCLVQLMTFQNKVMVYLCVVPASLYVL